MGKSMPIDRVNSASLLRGGAKPLVTERDDHLPEKNSWQKNEFNGHEPVELNHFSQKKGYYPVNFQSQRLLTVHRDFRFDLGLHGNGQVRVVKQPKHDQKSLEKDFPTVTEHTAEFSNHNPTPEKKNPPGTLFNPDSRLGIALLFGLC
jgi:hypothetical protein